MAIGGGCLGVAVVFCMAGELLSIFLLGGHTRVFKAIEVLTLAAAGLTAIVAVVAGLVRRREEVREIVSYAGDCPYCGMRLEFEGPVLGYDCPACKRRFVIQGERFARVD